LLHFTTGFFPSKNEIVLKKQTTIFKNKNKYTILFCFLFHYWLFLQHMKIENITEQQKTISKKHCNKKNMENKKQKHMKHTMGKCRLKQQNSVNGFKMMQRAKQWM